MKAHFAVCDYIRFARQNEAARAADASREVGERWLPVG